MNQILLAGVILNYCGAVKIFVSAMRVLPESAKYPSELLQSELLQFKFFTAGTAAVFGSLYLYLYFHPMYAIPFLVFGAVLKTWAFVLSLFLYFKQHQSQQAFIEFGVLNGIVAALFWYYIALNI